MFRRRLNYPNLKRAVVDLRDRFKPDHVLIEDKASGTQLIQDLQNGCIFYGVTPCVPPPGADKQMRLYAETALFEGGNVLLPH